MQEIIKLSDARTVTSSTLQFESNLKLANVLNLSNAAKDRPSAVLPCAWHAEREILAEILKGHPPDELLHIREHTGFVTAALIKDKILIREPNILICGSLNIYYVLEGLLLHNVISILNEDPSDINLLRNIVILDEAFSEDPFRRIGSLEEALAFLDGEDGNNINDDVQGLLSCICRQGDVGFWHPTLSLIHPRIVQNFQNVVCAVPVIKQDSYQYLLPFMRSYEPDVLAVLYPEAEKTLKTLKVLEWGQRWWLEGAPAGESNKYQKPQIVVYATDETIAREVREILYRQFSQNYGVFPPVTGISRELALLEKMVSTMRDRGTANG